MFSRGTIVALLTLVVPSRIMVRYRVTGRVGERPLLRSRERPRRTSVAVSTTIVFAGRGRLAIAGPSISGLLMPRRAEARRAAGQAVGLPVLPGRAI